MMKKENKKKSTTDIYNQATKLFESSDFEKLFLLLNDAILSEYNDANLYNIAGVALNRQGEHEKAIEYYTKAITIKKDSDYFFNRGSTWDTINQFENAIADFTIAIELKPKDPVIYNNRGIAYINLKEYKKALNDFNIAVKLAPSARYYNNIATALYDQGKYSEAITEYLKGIKLDDVDAMLYNNIGITYDKQKNYEEAINSYTKAIELDGNYYRAYNNRGVTLEHLGKYELALEDFTHSLAIEPNYQLAKSNRDTIRALLGIFVESDNESTTILQLFVKILENAKVDKDTRLQILKLCAEAKKDAIDKIRAHAANRIEAIISDNKVAHYTKLKVADIFATNKYANNRLRYYNAIYMNDPEEGLVLCEALGNEVKKCFTEASMQEEDNIYIGSFLPADRHADELVMWRTYGKNDDGVDGGGCSMIIDTDFFNEYKEATGYINPFIAVNPDLKTIDESSQCLYRVLYYNKNYKKRRLPMIEGDIDNKIANDILTLNEKLIAITKLKEARKKQSETNDAINKIIYHLLSEIRFFFKSADYAFENEVRVIQFVPKSSDELKIDESSTPKKVYIESNKLIQPYLEKIILGPKVPNPKQWLYLDVAMRKNNIYRDVSIDISECKYQ
jgi:tetratricopeptide (TPR) repeat protein